MVCFRASCLLTGGIMANQTLWASRICISILGYRDALEWKSTSLAQLAISLARITAYGFIDCSFRCALGDIQPSSRHYPDLEKRRIGGPKRDVIAGAQWILRRDRGRFVYRQCKQVEKVDGPRAMWSMERWRQWKDQLAFVAESTQALPP
jgi:hypothetical protein